MDDISTLSDIIKAFTKREYFKKYIDKVEEFENNIFFLLKTSKEAAIINLLNFVYLLIYFIIAAVGYLAFESVIIAGVFIGFFFIQIWLFYISYKLNFFKFQNKAFINKIILFLFYFSFLFIYLFASQSYKKYYLVGQNTDFKLSNKSAKAFRVLEENIFFEKNSTNKQKTQRNINDLYPNEIFYFLHFDYSFNNTTPYQSNQDKCKIKNYHLNFNESEKLINNLCKQAIESEAGDIFKIIISNLQISLFQKIKQLKFYDVKEIRAYQDDEGYRILINTYEISNELLSQHFLLKNKSNADKSNKTNINPKTNYYKFYFYQNNVNTSEENSNKKINLNKEDKQNQEKTLRYNYQTSTSSSNSYIQEDYNSIFLSVNILFDYLILLYYNEKERHIAYYILTLINLICNLYLNFFSQLSYIFSQFFISITTNLFTNSMIYFIISRIDSKNSEKWEFILYTKVVEILRIYSHKLHLCGMQEITLEDEEIKDMNKFHCYKNYEIIKSQIKNADEKTRLNLNNAKSQFSFKPSISFYPNVYQYNNKYNSTENYSHNEYYDNNTQNSHRNNTNSCLSDMNFMNNELAVYFEVEKILNFFASKNKNDSVVKEIKSLLIDNLFSSKEAFVIDSKGKYQLNIENLRVFDECKFENIQEWSYKNKMKYEKCQERIKVNNKIQQNPLNQKLDNSSIFVRNVDKKVKDIFCLKSDKKKHYERDNNSIRFQSENINKKDKKNNNYKYSDDSSIRNPNNFDFLNEANIAHKPIGAIIDYKNIHTNRSRMNSYLNFLRKFFDNSTKQIVYLINNLFEIEDNATQNFNKLFPNSKSILNSCKRVSKKPQNLSKLIKEIKENSGFIRRSHNFNQFFDFKKIEKKEISNNDQDINKLLNMDIINLDSINSGMKKSETENNTIINNHNNLLPYSNDKKKFLESENIDNSKENKLQNHKINGNSIISCFLNNEYGSSSKAKDIECDNDADYNIANLNKKNNPTHKSNKKIINNCNYANSNSSFSASDNDKFSSEPDEDNITSDIHRNIINSESVTYKKVCSPKNKQLPKHKNILNPCSGIPNNNEDNNKITSNYNSIIMTECDSKFQDYDKIQEEYGYYFLGYFELKNNDYSCNYYNLLTHDNINPFGKLFPIKFRVYFKIIYEEDYEQQEQEHKQKFSNKEKNTKKSNKKIQNNDYNKQNSENSTHKILKFLNHDNKDLSHNNDCEEKIQEQTLKSEAQMLKSNKADAKATKKNDENKTRPKKVKLIDFIILEEKGNIKNMCDINNLNINLNNGNMNAFTNFNRNNNNNIMNLNNRSVKNTTIISKSVKEIEAESEKKLAKVIHEFKTPLNAIIGLISDLMIKFDKGEKTEKIEKMMKKNQSKKSNNINTESRTNNHNEVISDNNTYKKHKYSNASNAIEINFKQNESLHKSLTAENQLKLKSSKQTLSIINSLSNYLIFLVSDFVQYSNSKRNQDIQVFVEKIELRSILEFCFDILNALLICRNAQVAIETIIEIEDKIGMLELKSDEMRLKQILLNLISNSVKFTKSGAIKILAKTKHNRSAVKITIEDTGMGIRPEDKQLLFKDFELKDKSKFNKHGSGLGLSICKFLADKLEHKLKIKSIHGEGTKITLEIRYTQKPTTNSARTIFSIPEINIFKNTTLKLSKADTGKKQNSLDNNKNIINNNTGNTNINNNDYILKLTSYVNSNNNFTNKFLHPITSREDSSQVKSRSRSSSQKDSLSEYANIKNKNTNAKIGNNIAGTLLLKIKNFFLLKKVL